MGITLYHSNPATGEVYETIEVSTADEKEFRLSPQGGDWWETPRWQRNPRPNGLSNENPYEKRVDTPYVEFPRVMHKKVGVDKQTGEVKWQTLTVKDEQAKQIALKGGYLLVPDESLHKILMGETPDKAPA